MSLFLVFLALENKVDKFILTSTQSFINILINVLFSLFINIF